MLWRDILIRSEHNPILTRKDIVSSHPALQDVSSVFNPGGILHEGKFLLLLRVQNRGRETFLLRAESADGIHFRVEPEPVNILHLHRCPHTVFHIYDPRITVAPQPGLYHVLCAMDTDKGCFLGLFTSEEFHILEFQGLVSEPDVRNGVLLAGTPYRFERPNTWQGADGIKTGKAITCSRSADFLTWEPIAKVMEGRPHYWDELIGSGPPPLKTQEGWLHIYHGVATHFGNANIYQAGVSLHDLSEPWKVLARGKYNILEPRELWELTGQVPNVVFPSAAIPLETDSDGCVPLDSPIYVYYGAADTCVGLAITTPQRLIDHCFAP